jgi:hypothetical protein
MWQIKSVAPWARKLVRRSLLLAGATTLLVPLALGPVASAQIVVGIGATPPVCSYGYYDYAPYGCAPSGFYGPGYFHGGIFLGVGPWANWGYGHGWGSYRFRGGGGGRYVAGRGNGGRAYAGNRGAHTTVVRSGGHAAAVHSSNGHAAVAHGAPHGGGGEHH